MLIEKQMHWRYQEETIVANALKGWGWMKSGTLGHRVKMVSLDKKSSVNYQGLRPIFEAFRLKDM